jgi:uncharacterized membrane protein (UPF0127 family)
MGAGRGAPPRRGARRLGVLALLLAAGCGAGPVPAEAPEAWVSIRGERVAAEVADTRAEQVQGLSGRDALAWGRGMLFLYDRPGFYAFWMKDMRFDIDIVWIREHHVVGITNRAPAPPEGTPEGELPAFQPGELVDAVLEVPAGFAAASGWQSGDFVRIERPSPSE